MSSSKRPILRTVSHAERQLVGRGRHSQDHRILRTGGESSLDFSGIAGASGRKQSFWRQRLEGVRSFFLGA